MSVYIKGLKIPEKDGVLTLRIWGSGQVERLESYHSWLLSSVKAVPVPSHGGLIDASVLQADGWTIQRIFQSSPSEMTLETKNPLDFPIVIPASDEGE